MKVFDLQCDGGHVFEGWFASDEAWRDQSARGLVECPLCATATVTRMPSAPRLNFGARQPVSGPPSQPSDSTLPALRAPEESEIAPDALRQFQAEWMKRVRQVMTETEDVGRHFADEARRIHHGEIEARGIRGEATAMEAMELLEEGIGVVPLAIPKALKEPLQ